MSSVSCHSQDTDGTDATMLDPASRSGSSVSCHSQSTGDTDATMSDLDEDVLMDGQVVVGNESTGGAKSVWKMKAAKDAEEEYYDPEREYNILGEPRHD